jgi:hypothetical protein
MKKLISILLLLLIFGCQNTTTTNENNTDKNTTKKTSRPNIDLDSLCNVKELGNYYECGQEKERFLLKYYSFISRNKKELIINCLDGKALLFKDTDEFAYSVTNVFEEQGIAFLEKIGNEWALYYIVDLINGKVLNVINKPLFSPDKNSFMAYEGYNPYAQSGLEIWTATDNPKWTKQFEYYPKPWYIDTVFWRGNDRLELSNDTLMERINSDSIERRVVHCRYIISRFDNHWEIKKE